MNSIPSITELVNTSLERLYKDKQCNIWFALYEEEAWTARRYNYHSCYNNQFDHKYSVDCSSIQMFTVTINSIKKYSDKAQYEIMFDPIQFHHHTISRFIFENQKIDLV